MGNGMKIQWYMAKNRHSKSRWK